jgi:hypothetical protein
MSTITTTKSDSQSSGNAETILVTGDMLPSCNYDQPKNPAVVVLVVVVVVLLRAMGFHNLITSTVLKRLIKL